ncbi:MAG: dihydrolipoamide acyltransferase [Paludibacteraceae bacterium]|nr:dihydrolipoamide acyltransferase [Paludibacteraceae bacterium]MBO7258891.1 dihydrolipoamide acyltransferase [Paludibacteraceae bacterium]
MEAILKIEIKPTDSAQALGSGTLPVFGTPAMIALMEATAQKAVPELQEGETTVGTYIEAHHVKAAKIGDIAICKAVLVAQEGRKLVYEVRVEAEDGTLMGHAKHERFVVQSERFMSKL